MRLDSIGQKFLHMKCRTSNASSHWMPGSQLEAQLDRLRRRKVSASCVTENERSMEVCGGVAHFQSLVVQICSRKEIPGKRMDIGGLNGMKR